MVALMFALGLMSKPQVITLPFVLLLWDYWPLGRMFPSAPDDSPGVARAAGPAKNFGWLVEEKLPLFGIALASAVITMHVQRMGGASELVSAVGPAGERNCQLRAICEKGFVAVSAGTVLSASRESFKVVGGVWSIVILLAITAFVVVSVVIAILWWDGSGSWELWFP